MKIASAILESAALALLTFWTLRHVHGSADFSDAMAGVLVGIAAVWAIAWSIPDGLSMLDRSIDRRKKVFERSD